MKFRKNREENLHQDKKPIVNLVKNISDLGFRKYDAGASGQHSGKYNDVQAAVCLLLP